MSRTIGGAILIFLALVVLFRVPDPTDRFLGAAVLAAMGAVLLLISFRRK